MKRVSSFVMFVFICSVVNLATADSYTTYTPSYAVSYAVNNYNTAYGTGGSENPFGDFSSMGGNCTNFASQAIIAGMVNSSSMSTVYGDRQDFDIDADGCSYCWYYQDMDHRGTAFTDADELFNYADNNAPQYRGLHFEYVTNDTLEDFMDYSLVEPGDIIFADWTHDGEIDHTMIVTDYCETWQWCYIVGGLRGYNRIRVTYQSTSTNHTDKGLGDINEEQDYEALFYVYRPTDYNPNGW